jgi:hypothetical protein
MEREFNYRTLSNEEQEEFQRLLIGVDSTKSIISYLTSLAELMSFADTIADLAITIETYRDSNHMFREISEKVVKHSLDLRNKLIKFQRIST